MPASEETPVLVALESGVLSLTLNRPTRLNAMSQALIASISEQIGRAGSDDAVRAVLITGTGRGFCAGADLAGSGTGAIGADGKPDLGGALGKAPNSMIPAIPDLPNPVVPP